MNTVQVIAEFTCVIHIIHYAFQFWEVQNSYYYLYRFGMQLIKQLINLKRC